MELNYDEQQKRIEYFVAQANETKSVVKLLQVNSKTNAGYTQLFQVLSYLLSAIAAKYGQVFKSTDELMQWVHDDIVKKQLLPYSTYSFIANMYTIKKKIESEPFIEQGKEHFEKDLKELKETKGKLEQFIHESPNLVPETIACIKKSIEIEGSATAKATDKDLAKKYIRFIEFRLLLKSKKGKEIYDEFKQDISNSKLEGSLETHIEDILSENESLKKELTGFVNQFKQAHIDITKFAPVAKSIPKDVKTESKTEVAESKPKEEPVVTEKSEGKKEQNKDKENLFLVLWDFTQEADNALQHAIKFVKQAGGEVKLLHIVKKAKEVIEAEEKLNKVAKETQSKYGILPKVMASPGNIFTDISKIADELRANIVFMGTHGMKGMQKVTGSWALKVITDTKEPFFVIQGPPKYDEMKEVVFPIDHRKDEKILLNQVKFLSSYFKLKYHIIKPASFPNDTFKNKTTHNFVFIKSYFKQNKKEFDVTTKGTIKEVPEIALEYAQKNKCDMIMIITTKDLSKGDLMFGAVEQKLLANPYQIPILCVNPLHAKGWFYGSSK